MRRGAVQVLRAARRPLFRSLHRGRPVPVQSHYGHGVNARQSLAGRDRAIHVLPSSMYFRNFSVALLSTLVASGAYFAYQGKSGTASDASGFSNQHTKPFSTVNTFSSGSPTAIETAVQATRKALLIDQGQLFTGTLQGDGPLTKNTDDYGRKVLEMMTPEQATARLRRNEQSYLVGRGKGVVRYDVVQLPSNDPIEDDHAEQIVEVPKSTSGTASNSDWMFWGVFDGHSGWTTSARLRQALISYVARELNGTYSSIQTSQSNEARLPTPAAIDAAIKRGFVALDTSIVQDSVTEVLKSKSKPQAAQLLAPALSGSCALLSFYDTASKTLRVACTGDSRAILGRRSLTDSSKWLALPLSVDQTGANEEEAARLRAEHPNEPNVVRNGRVLGGLEPSRAFGDAIYKWSKEVQDRIKREYFGRTRNEQVKTPPYVTAEPIVTTTKVEPAKGDFLVMATDGLWEMLTNEEVVGLVGQWLETHPEAQRGSSASTSQPSKDAQAGNWVQSWLGGSKQQDKGLPVEGGQSSQNEHGGQRAPIRQQQWGLSPSTSAQQTTPSSDRFVVEDQNVATHLVRNALGGKNRDMVCALLTLPSPYSRRYRDDLTVEVIFFGDEPEDIANTGDGKVLVNQQASSNITDDLKAKL